MVFMSKFGSGGLVVKDANGIDLSSLRNSMPALYAEEKHHSRSDRYSMVRTIDVLDAFMQNGFKPTEVRLSGSRVEGKQAFGKHMIRFRQQNAMVKVNDIFPEVVLINSHDGTSSYQLSTGWYRLACSNGLCTPISEDNAINVRHSGNVDDVIDASFRVISDFESQLGAIETMKRIKLSQPEQKVLAATALNMKMDDEEKAAANASTILRPRRMEDTKSDLWTTFNVIQENVIQGGRRVDRKKMRTVNGIDENVKLNRALWSLAEKMAEIKGFAVA